MREHMGLYRGKRQDNGEWVEGNLLTLHDGRCFIVNNIFGACIDADGNFINTESPFVCEVDPDTVGECTGLKDKNGKLIFEGDIVEDASIGLLGDVVFSIVGVPSYGINDVHDGLQYHDGFWSDLEVIGNIHDNPELMKGESNGGKE